MEGGKKGRREEIGTGLALSDMRVYTFHFFYSIASEILHHLRTKNTHLSASRRCVCVCVYVLFHVRVINYHFQKQVSHLCDFDTHCLQLELTNPFSLTWRISCRNTPLMKWWLEATSLYSLSLSTRSILSLLSLFLWLSSINLLYFTLPIIFHSLPVPSFLPSFLSSFLSSFLPFFYLGHLT